MFRVVLIAVGCFTALLIAFSFLMGVSKMDVSIKHQMQHHVVAEPYGAGDIVGVSPDGTRGALLCSLNLDLEQRMTTRVDVGYYNVVDQSQQRFVGFVNRAKEMFGLPVVEADGGSSDAVILPFHGEVHRAVGDFSGMLTRDCMCDMAKAVIERRNTACVVAKSLVETKLTQGETGIVVERKTVGVSFDPDPIVLDDLAALAGICPGLNVAGRPPVNQSCQGSSGFSFDVVARAKIGLIREAELR